MESDAIKISLLSIQSDWELMLNYKGEEIWISAKTRNNPSVQGILKRIKEKVNGQADEENFNITENFKIEKIIGNSLLIISYEDVKTLFLAPCKTFNQIHDHRQIVCIDTNENSKHNAVTASENIFKKWDTRTSNISLEYKGHVSDINKVYYFPSGAVFISCSLDMQIKIVCAETGANPRTLKGHTRSVTDISIVARGKNIISVSKDCRVLLWNVAESKIISEILKTNYPILCCAISTTDFILPHLKEEEEDELEFETHDKILIIGCENGDVYLIAVECKKVLTHLQLDSEVRNIKFINSNLFLVGLKNGKILKYEIKQLNNNDITVSCLQSWHYTDSAVLCLLPCTEHGFITGYHDGHCIFQFYDNVNHQIHLTGSMFDPIFDISFDGTYVLTTCRDGNIRKYLIDKLLIEKIFLNKK